MIINDDDGDDDDDGDVKVFANRNVNHAQFKEQPQLLRKESKQKEVETPRVKLLLIFCSLISQSGSTTFCQNNILSLYDPPRFVNNQRIF